MTDFGTLAEGVGLALIGSFMAFAPEAASRLNQRVPWVRLGGGLGRAFGYGAMLVGGGLIMAWLFENLWLVHSN